MKNLKIYQCKFFTASYFLIAIVPKVCIEYKGSHMKKINRTNTVSDEHGFPRLLSRKWGEGASRNSCSVVFNTDRFGESRGSKNTSQPPSLTKMLLPTKHHRWNFNTNIFYCKSFFIEVMQKQFNRDFMIPLINLKNNEIKF